MLFALDADVLGLLRKGALEALGGAAGFLTQYYDFTQTKGGYSPEGEPDGA